MLFRWFRNKCKNVAESVPAAATNNEPKLDAIILKEAGENSAESPAPNNTALVKLLRVKSAPLSTTDNETKPIRPPKRRSRLSRSHSSRSVGASPRGSSFGAFSRNSSLKRSNSRRRHRSRRTLREGVKILPAIKEQSHRKEVVWICCWPRKSVVRPEDHSETPRQNLII